MADRERSAGTGTAESDIGNTDVWSDGQETASDRRIREFTVRELEKSKKTLPKDRYEALVRAVGEILRNHYVHEEEVREIVRVKISEFKDVVPNDETLGTRDGGARKIGNDAVTEQLKTKFNFLKDTNGKYYERAGGKVSSDFSSILSGVSISGFSNAEIADVFSFAYVHSNKEYPLKNESSRISDAVGKIRARFSNDPAGLVKISEGWGGDYARTQPSIDKRLQVGDSKGIRNEFIRSAKESFRIATGNLVEWFVTKQLWETADAEKITKVAGRIKDAVEKTPADSSSNYFAKVWSKVEAILKEAGVRNVEAKDNLQFIRQMLGLSVASREFDAKNDPKSAKYGEAFKECETNERVEKIEAELVAKHPSDAGTIRKAAQTARLRIANPELWGAAFRAHGGKPLSNSAAEAVMRHEGPVTEASAKKHLARTMKAEGSGDELERRLGNAQLRKPIGEMSVGELEAVRDVLRSNANPTEDEKATLALLEKHLADKADARREYVAIATKRTYEEVVALEKSGQSMDALYEKARKEPLFPQSAPKAEADSRAVGEVFGTAYFGERRTFGDGETRTIRFEGSEVPVSVTKTGDGANPYRISVNGKESFECDGKSLEAHLEMAKFLCDNGLEFLAPVTSEMIRRNSVREGNLATAKDGTFGEREKKIILTGFANAYELEGFPKDATESSAMESHLKTFATERATTFRDLGTRAKILDENGNFRNREKFLDRTR